MEGSIGARPPPARSSYSPWDLLHVSLQVTILCLLPVSTLIVLTSVSKSLRSAIRSPNFISSYRSHARRRPRRDQDVLFLLFTDPALGIAVAYHPSRDRLIHLHLPSDTCCNSICRGGSLLMSMQYGRHVRISNPLRPAQTTFLPVMKPYRPYISPFTLIELISPHHVHYYMAVSLSGDNTQVYDSRSGQWHLKPESIPLGLPPRVGAYVNGLIYVISLRRTAHRLPSLDLIAYCLLTFDPVGGDWAVLDVTMPQEAPFPSGCELLAFDGGLFFVARVADSWEIRVWKLDMEEMIWRVFSSMPAELSDTFGAFDYRECNRFECAHSAGRICMYEYNREHVFLMCDLVDKRWWKFRCDVFFDRSVFLGRALEPQIDLVMPLPSNASTSLQQDIPEDER